MKWQRWLILGGVPALMVAAIALLLSRSPPDQTPKKIGPAAPTVATEAPVLARQLDVPGTLDPTFVDAASAGLAPDDSVIGLVVEGEPRAYLKRALSGVAKNHVVSDRTPSGRITVTHCDLSHCTRVFVEDRDEQPKEIRVGGLQRDRSLELLIDGRRYPQRDAKIPLQEYPFAETSWEKWVAEHPQTKVYVGARTDG